ncbi:hypothetical protein AgCh_001410 [Apium graveolens]
MPRTPTIQNPSDIFLSNLTLQTQIDYEDFGTQVFLGPEGPYLSTLLPCLALGFALLTGTLKVLGYNLRFWGDFIKNKPWGVLGIGCGKLGAEWSRNREQNEHFSSNLLGAHSGKLGGRSGS